jgi:hypothetical protein
MRPSNIPANVSKITKRLENYKSCLLTILAVPKFIRPKRTLSLSILDMTKSIHSNY